MKGLSHATGVCERNDRRYVRPYRAIAIILSLSRKLGVVRHIALEHNLSSWSFFCADTGIVFGLCKFNLDFGSPPGELSFYMQISRTYTGLYMVSGIFQGGWNHYFSGAPR